MTIYISQYNISINKLIGKLLPWFMRGRKLYYILCGSLNPLKSLHTNFIAWAQQKHEDARLTFQVMSMEWYLNKTLKGYFKDDTQTVKIDLFAHKNYDIWVDTFANKDNGNHSDTYLYPFSAGHEGDSNITYFKSEVTGSTTNRFNISVPDINDTITKEEYTNLIKQIIRKYSLIRKYTIIIQDL